MVGSIIRTKALYKAFGRSGLVFSLSLLILFGVFYNLLKQSFLFSLIFSFIFAGILGYLTREREPKTNLSSTFNKNNQKRLKQGVYFFLPLILVLDIIGIFISSTINLEISPNLVFRKYLFMTLLPFIFIGWFLSYWRLKNAIKEQGEDKTPVFTSIEVIVLIIALLVIGGIFYFLYRINGNSF